MAQRWERMEIYENLFQKIYKNFFTLKFKDKVQKSLKRVRKRKNKVEILNKKSAHQKIAYMIIYSLLPILYFINKNKLSETPSPILFIIHHIHPHLINLIIDTVIKKLLDY